MATASHNELFQADNLIFQPLINQLVAEGEAEADAISNLLHPRGRSSTHPEIEANDYRVVMIIGTTFGTRLKIREIYIKSVFIRICQEILLRGDNFTVADFFNGRYDNSLEFLIISDMVYFRRKFRRFWNRLDQLNVVLAIFNGVREYSFFKILGLLSKCTGKEIIGRYLKKRRKDECEDDICPVCLDPLDQEDEVTMVAILDCRHEYHVDCIVSWLILGKNICPLCRGMAIYDWKSGTMRFQRSLLQC